MEVIRGLIPLMIILGIVGVVIFFWSVRTGQYDDLEGDANRILMDDDDPLLPSDADADIEKRGGNKKSSRSTKQPGRNWPDAD